jgi:ribosome-binding protein aMBF1 (putative translation factor)
MSKLQEIINDAEELIALKGWSKKRLAKEAGVQENTLRYLGHGEFNPRFDTLQGIETVTKKYLPEKAAT